MEVNTIKLIEENIGRTLFDINQDQCRDLYPDLFYPDGSILGPISNNNENKTKINRWDLIKLKSFCTEIKP